LIEPADDEDPDNDQSLPSPTEQASLKSNDGLLTTELLEDDEAGR
jgi:hypothetical protein